MKKAKVSLTLDDTLIMSIDRIVFDRRGEEQQSLKQTSRSQVIEELIQLGLKQLYPLGYKCKKKQTSKRNRH